MPVLLSDSPSALVESGPSLPSPRGGGCSLFQPGSRAVIGVLGNSVAWGTGVGPENAWPALLNRSLRAKFGPHITVVNGAVRASAPDFASLCWDEIWSSRQAPTLDRATLSLSLRLSIRLSLRLSLTLSLSLSLSLSLKP